MEAWWITHRKRKKIKLSHDFYQDIVASAKYIGKRYRYSKVHAQYITDLALEIFDKTKRFTDLHNGTALFLKYLRFFMILENMLT